jgi:hypothetical protein
MDILVKALYDASDKWRDKEHLSTLLAEAASTIARLEQQVERAESQADGLSRVLRELIAEQVSKKPRPKAKQSIPPSWKVTDELLDWVKSTFPDLDGENEAEGFKEYWLASGDTKLNWDMAFRTWCRNADKWARAKPRGSRAGAYASPDQVSDGNRERIRTLLGKLDAE